MKVYATVDINYVSLDKAIVELQRAKQELLDAGCRPDSLIIDVSTEQEPYSNDEYVVVEVFGYNDKKK